MRLPILIGLAGANPALVYAAIAGVLFTLYTRSGYSLAAVGVELDAIAAVVIGGALLTGGYGFVLGSMLGVLPGGGAMLSSFLITAMAPFAMGSLAR